MSRKRRRTSAPSPAVRPENDAAEVRTEESQPVDEPQEPAAETPAERTEEPAPAEPAPQEAQQEAAVLKDSAQKGDWKMIAFGAVVLVFAVIGLISTISLVSSGVASLIRQDSRQEEYEWFITPLVLQDPPQFESPEELTDSTIITAGVWRLIMNEDTSKYPVDDLNFITVPATDVEVQIRALFGDVDYTHQSVGDSTLMITYEEESGSYVFPASPHVLAYTPDVQEIERTEDGAILLTVGYIPPGPVWQGDTEGRRYQPSADKVMEITLVEDEDGNLTIYSLTGENGGVLPEASAPEESSEPAESSAEEPAEGAPAEESSVEESIAEDSAAEDPAAESSATEPSAESSAAGE